MRGRSLDRRELLAMALGGALLPAVLSAQQQRPASPAPAPAPADPLYDPNSLERRDAIVEETDNDATANEAEHRLACPCPCTLDVFTCRTTDFTCSYSPARHKEVVALVEQGMNVQQILDTMVARYGEEALMAPIPKGFNIVGYVLPASVVLGLGAIILAILALRQRAAAVQAVAVAAAGPSARPDDGLSAEDIARIERELSELES
ncbi:MAG: cytochrome c-type biogenesis protein CcmH [Gemmatimonadetes bacterium]|nr:cytochrome c-type biogenesis protein CcmH [Gemmatimonadota bacterium]